MCCLYRAEIEHGAADDFGSSMPTVLQGSECKLSELKQKVEELQTGLVHVEGVVAAKVSAAGGHDVHEPEGLGPGAAAMLAFASAARQRLDSLQARQRKLPELVTAMLNRFSQTVPDGANLSTLMPAAFCMGVRVLHDKLTLAQRHGRNAIDIAKEFLE